MLLSNYQPVDFTYSREMMIVFVYDTARCRREEDDPAEAVIYFHPAWVSLTQRLALAGQLMGVTQFLTTSFSPPRVISLQGGKFVLKKLGQYILAVGTDRNIQDWVIQRRADTLESTLKFYHRDLETISTSLGGDRNRLTEKLYQMFETYLPILQYSANLFTNLPTIKFPKSASNVFLEAIQVLQYCQETSGILGGALFYNNKVVATQLNPELTKQLIVTDPYRIKAPAETVGTEFDLPAGVQLLRVYVERKQVIKLKQDAAGERVYNSYLDPTMKKTMLKKNLSKNNIKDSCTSGMKRDTSRIFTVPEEGELDSMQYDSGAPFYPSLPPTTYSSPAKRKQDVTIDRSKIVNPLTPSVCSTPLKDVNRMLHGTTVLICSGADDCESKAMPENQVLEVENISDIPDLVKEALRCKRANKLRNAPPIEKLEERRFLDKKCLSLPDLNNALHKHTNRVSLRYYSIGLPNLNDNLCSDLCEDSPRKKLPPGKHFYHTITDPSFPIFRSDGSLVSKALYDFNVATHYQELKCGATNVKLPKHTDFFQKFPSMGNDKAAMIEGLHCQVPSVSENNTVFNANVTTEKKTKQEIYRRSMSLPLKSLNAPEEEGREKSSSECGSIFDLPQRKKLDGLQLTPLMSKLSLLADERTSGFCSRETTPNEFRDLSSFSTTTNHLLRSKLDAASKDGSDEEDDLDQDWIYSKTEESSLEKLELFIYGQQNMVLVLLMEENVGNNFDLIHSLWDTCVQVLAKLECKLQRCLEPLPPSDSRELYSVLSVDPQWDTVHRAGLWGVTEIEIVSFLHDRFSKAGNMTDIVVRTEDTVVYGYQCGKLQVFYQQAMAPNMTGGLPTPADLMGVVPLKAKRRLERDHGIVLL
ncbi:uncharacterized protein LOC124305782 isoform X2 [Neodiprion virginianus]|uniref:uncharacterized protein LOC124305782 isoform X2 n=1 Tax=Neodiprion virginianus TaxID=2961670 RepID=UPI001EE6E8F5|nr:uncharacterized protein LOC124305782 isoform X2 [Neodiprion virginianus]